MIYYSKFLLIFFHEMGCLLIGTLTNKTLNHLINYDANSFSVKVRKTTVHELNRIFKVLINLNITCYQPGKINRMLSRIIINNYYYILDTGLECNLFN